ncbi:MAG TPA: hypothetical protein DDW76_09380 [Cyanobacteria bacterium UBA11369]|nr:hypothetical protein [Cyanobacteria bacterium UBA8553]HAZ44459.1 hypothetical protein [Cyanobacteria bacterium UBA11371]HBE17642.1 hypothetical protein [Cyanobacteria bacterium UBA11367]HBE35623.1 hypothetical protein [Cyanobacteria bacterium UBA11368]HBE48991.1 hypothetical protein [Cyanobacteria bacterium UBA11369]
MKIHGSFFIICVQLCFSLSATLIKKYAGDRNCLLVASVADLYEGSILFLLILISPSFLLVIDAAKLCLMQFQKAELFGIIVAGIIQVSIGESLYYWDLTRGRVRLR